jgi:hypothetical protein
MRIPANSTFTKELSKRIPKQFKEMFSKDMSFGGLQNLQEQLDLIDSVDTHLVNQVSQLNKGNGHEQSKKNVPNARAVRQEYTQKESIAGTVAKSGTKNKEVGLAVTSS